MKFRILNRIQILTLITSVILLNFTCYFNFKPKDSESYHIDKNKINYENEKIKIEVSGKYGSPGANEIGADFTLSIVSKTDTIIMNKNKFDLIIINSGKKFSLMSLNTTAKSLDNERLYIQPRKKKKVYLYFFTKDGSLFQSYSKVKNIDVMLILSDISVKNESDMKIPEFIFSTI